MTTPPAYFAPDGSTIDISMITDANGVPINALLARNAGAPTAVCGPKYSNDGTSYGKSG